MTSDDFFEEIQIHFNNELPFVIYRKPNETSLKTFLQKDATLHEINDFNETGFVFAPFDNNEKAILISNSNSNFRESDILTATNNVTAKNTKFSYSEKTKKNHIALVQKAISKIRASQIKKVVVSRKEEITIDDNNPIDIFKRLLNKYPSAFVYCWYHPKIGLWLGATPETLLKIEGNRLTTMSLAGTQKYIGTEDVVWQEKEKNEQQLVTDFIVGSLQSSVGSLQSSVDSRQSSVDSPQSSINDIKVSETKTFRTGNLLHLKTDITTIFKAETLNLKQILTKLHPTPAVCGLPKEIARQFILENENYEREFYTGFLGELNLKEKKSRNSNRQNVENNAYTSIKTISNLYVNLRCMQLKDDTAILYMGGGITKDSDPEMEWEETVSKSEVIKSVL